MDSHHAPANNIAENTTSRLKSVLSGVGLFLMFMLMIVMSIIGRKEPPDYFLNRSIGKFEVVTYKYGLFLREKGTKQYYNVSPYSTPKQENESATLLHWNRTIEAKEMNPKFGSIEKKILYILSYYSQIKPSATFKQLKINTEFPTPESTLITLNEGNVITITFDSTDYVVDDKRNAYIYDSDTYLSESEKFMGLPLNHIESSESYIPIPKGNRNIIIANPQNSGAIKIRTDNPDISKILINQADKRLELYFRENKLPKLLIQSKDSLKEAITSYSL